MRPKQFLPPDAATSDRKRATAAAALAIPLALTLAACGGGQESAQSAQGPGGQQQQQARPVEVMRVSARDVAYTQQLPGRARAFSEAEIRPQVTGLIQKRLFTEGEEVAEGQALYQIDKAEYAAAYASAKASLARAEAQAAVAAETFQRFEHLSAINAVSQQDYDDAAAALKQAEADVAVARADLRTASINLERTTVKSPIAGRIGRSSVTPGALVTQNQATALARVVRLDPIYIDLTVSSTQLLNWRQAVAEGRIDTGDSGAVKVTVQLENGQRYPHPGQLEFSEVNVDEQAGSVALRATAPNPDGLLLPGMYVKAEIEAGAYSDAYMLPQSVVSRTPRGDATVFVVNAENKIETRMLTVAQANGSRWIVTGGLQDGDAIVVSGFQSIREGMSVIPQEADEDRLAALMNG